LNELVVKGDDFEDDDEKDPFLKAIGGSILTGEDPFHRHQTQVRSTTRWIYEFAYCVAQGDKTIRFVFFH